MTRAPWLLIVASAIGCVERRDYQASGDATSGIDAPAPDASSAMCPAGYQVVGTGGYRFVAAGATWEAARADCADDDDAASPQHTHLAVFGGEIERVGVSATFSGVAMWIGLSDRVTPSVWRWVTLEPVGSYPPATGPPWRGGQPDDGGTGTDDCVLMLGDGTWDDRPCDNDTHVYVCECDAFPEVASQSDP